MLPIPERLVGKELKDLTQEEAREIDRIFTHNAKVSRGNSIMSPDFSTCARNLLVAFASSRKADQMRKTATFSPAEEPDLVPKGHYAVVIVEYRPFAKQDEVTTWAVGVPSEAVTI